MKLIDNIGLSYLIGKLKALIELKADKTYVDNKVKTDVPTGAKFTDTDTITTINGKTGTISKADIVALGIPAQDTVVDISGKADKTYVDNKVKTDVPVGAKFTDTITTINGKTGTITKADITALGIPAQDTVVDISGKADKTELFKITIGLTQPTSGWWYKEII